MDEKELESAVEGILFASGEPIQTDRICLALSLEREEVEEILRRLRDYYAFERRGMRLLQLEDRWQLCSSPDHADVIRKAFEIRKPAKLSQPALEALTIIAYYQPTTRAYVDKLRGVDSAYTVGLLLERGLIETCGNLQAPGRPLLYRTTEKFLRSFHISSLDELPPLNEDDAPPQQLRIEDMAQRLTETPDASEAAETAQASEMTETAPEAAQEPQTAEMIEESPEVSEEATEETPEISEEAIEETAEVPEEVIEETAEASAEVPEEALAEATETPDAPSETRIATRELMLAEYPFVLTARRSQKRKASPRKPKRLAGTFQKRKKRPGHKARKRRKPPLALRDISPEGGDIETNVACNRSPAPTGRGTGGRASRNAPRRKRRKTKRLAETFRTRRKRPGRKARKCRRIARPRRTATENPAPDSVSAVSTPPEARESVSKIATPPKAARRKLSGKAVRRCLHCLLFGCWLSWPFC